MYPWLGNDWLFGLNQIKPFIKQFFCNNIFVMQMMIDKTDINIMIVQKSVEL